MTPQAYNGDRCEDSNDEKIDTRHVKHVNEEIARERKYIQLVRSLRDVQFEAVLADLEELDKHLVSEQDQENDFDIRLHCRTGIAAFFFAEFLQDAH